MNRVLFYVDKECVEKFCDILKEIFLANGICGVPIITSLGSDKSNKAGKEWVSYDIEQRFEVTQLEAIADKIDKKINDIVRGFLWEPFGVTGFEEVKVKVSEERVVEMRLLGKEKAD